MKNEIINHSLVFAEDVAFCIRLISRELLTMGYVCPFDHFKSNYKL